MPEKKQLTITPLESCLAKTSCEDKVTFGRPNPSLGTNGLVQGDRMTPVFDRIESVDRYQEPDPTKDDPSEKVERLKEIPMDDSAELQGRPGTK